MSFRPVPRIGAVLVAVLADVACFLLFAAVGRRSHGEDEGVLAVVRTALPFVVAWLCVAPALGVYLRPTARRVALAWLAAWPLALALRAAGGRGVPLAFDLVALVVNLALLLGWRLAVRRTLLRR